MPQQYKCPERGIMKRRGGIKQTQNCGLWILWRLPTKSCSYFYCKNLVLQNIFISYFLYRYEFQQTDDDFPGYKVVSLKHGVQGFRDMAQSVHCLGWITRISFLSLETMSEIETTNNTKRVLLHASVITELSGRRQEEPWGLQVKLHGKFQGTWVTHNSL